MSWCFYDDELPQNRKVAWLRAHGEAGIAALGLHLLANTWSRHEGMQGFIPDYMPEQLTGRTGPKLAALLAEIDMFIPTDGGWMINDYADYGRDDGTSADEKKARLSRVRAEAGRKGGLAKAKQGRSKRSSKRVAEPVAKGQQTSSPTPIPTDSPTSKGSPTVPAGSVAQVIRAYVDSGQSVGMPTPEASQDKVSRSARLLLASGYPINDVTEAAKNAAVAGWTDLAVQLQRDAARASPTVTGPEGSTTDQRFNASVDIGRQVAAELAQLDQPERRALG